MEELVPRAQGPTDSELLPSAEGESRNPWARLVRTIRAGDRLPLLILLVVAGTLTGVWTYYDWLRLMTFHQYVYDLGVEYQAVWAAAHGTSLNVAGPNGYRLIVYVLVPSLLAFPTANQFLPLYMGAQNAALFAGCLPLYLVARDVLKTRFAGLSFGLAYLLFAPLYGPVWFPVHPEAFFPVIFLTAYWLLRTNRLRGALALCSLALLTNIGASLVLVAWGIGMLVEPRVASLVVWLRRRKDPSRPHLAHLLSARPRDWFALYLLVVPSVFFVVATLNFGTENFLYFTTQSSFSSGTFASHVIPFNPLANPWSKLATLSLILGPLLALPLLAREERWALIPFFGAAFLTGNHPGMLFPFKDQYDCFVLPALFAAAIRGIERLEHRQVHRSEVRVATRIRRLRARLPRSSAGWSALMLAGVVIAGSVFAPWGPANTLLQHSPLLGAGYYNLYKLTHGNATRDRELSALIDSIPTNGPLLAQNNLPQAVARPVFFVPGLYATTFPSQYLLTDPYDNSFYPGTNFGPFPGSMLDWANYYINNGWGFYGEADGAVLLEANYTGPLHVFYPTSHTFVVGDFPCCTTTGVWNGQSGKYLFAGPRLPFDESCSVFVPGVFWVNVTLHVDHPLPTDQLTLQVGENGGATPLQSFSLTGASWAGRNGTVVASVQVGFSGYYPQMFLALHVDTWSTPLRYTQVSLVQEAWPGAPPGVNISTPPPSSVVPGGPPYLPGAWNPAVAGLPFAAVPAAGLVLLALSRRSWRSPH